jgi:dTDP-4-dehydrorhamnose 3,5-epimerase
VDLRFGSATYGQHFAVKLAAENHRALFIPESFAHGFQTLADDTEVHYQMNQLYTKGYGRGYRYDDPAFRIRWPMPVTVISKQDLDWGTFPQ